MSRQIQRNFCRFGLLAAGMAIPSGLARAQPAPTTRPADNQPKLVLVGKVPESRVVFQPLDPEVHGMLNIAPSVVGRAATGIVTLQGAPSGKTAYLGISVEPPNATLRAQLSLPDSVGLVITYVDAEGPANDALHVHDILEKLDDQILVNNEQLIALVRMHKAGDSITLTLIREAKSTAVTLKLIEKEMPADTVAAMTIGAPESANTTLDVSGLTFARLTAGDGTRFDPEGADVVARLMRTGPTRLDDGEMVVWTVNKGGDYYLVAAESTTGKVLYSGPIATTAQWKSIPENIREKLNGWYRLINPSSERPTEELKSEIPANR